ncbi:hypothetical protein V1279_002943 [Bradyrhizobium sp. AZCC 1610]|uniref:hypothetical protein n=1 Tax=Bradyrhizobium sp. AZCC 1610 TaxID=3117020 RepID=UPI002FEF966F
MSTKQQDNLAIWDAVETTDMKYTKQFNRGGGFKGTSINATYSAKKATQVFGPLGIGWGWNVIDEKYQPGQDKDIVHVVRIKLWYEWNGKRGEIEHFGQTQFVGKNKNGYYTDEEAPKKSLTDAISKGLSLLGFGADVHLGLYDDNRYINDRKADMRDGVDAFNNDNERRSDRNDDRGPSGDHQKDDGGLTAEEADAILDKWEKAIAGCKNNAEVLTLVGSDDFKDDLAKLHVDDEKFLRQKANARSKELKAAKDKAA